MRFEIVVATHPRALSGLDHEPPPASHLKGADPETPRPHHAPLRLVAPDPRQSGCELLDVFVDGTNVTSGIRETHGAFVLRDLALTLLSLARHPHGKGTVRFYDEPWELCVERFGSTACLSLYLTGADPQVTMYDRPVPFDEVVAAAQAAIDGWLSGPFSSGGTRLELESASAQLHALGPVAHEAGPHPLEPLPAPLPLPEPVPVAIEPDSDAPLSFGAEFTIREREPSMDAEAALERADLHALLFRGRVRAEVRGRTVDLGECHPFLVAEKLVELARRAFHAWERGLPLHARGEAAGVLAGVRVSTDGGLSLTLGGCGRPRAVHTFPALGVADVVEAALSFGRALVRAILRRDRTQSGNLRLSALRRALRDGAESFREASQTDSKVNAAPEPYRAFAAALHTATESRSSSPAPSPSAGRLRYAQRWRAIVPGIDLRATYLCGDRLIVGAPTEMWALDRTTGRVLWRTDVTRGASVVTPGGIARLAPDGTLRVHDFATGAPTLKTRITPRIGGPIAGAVVHLPGLPKLVIVTEGEHHLVAIDLATGDMRWRWSWGGGRGASRGAPRMKRSGRLVFFTCADGALTALDVMSGAVVWRLRDRLRFRTAPAIGHESLYAVAGGAHGMARLYSIDPYSGQVRWTEAVTDPSAPCTVEGAPIVATHAVAVAVRSKTGLSLTAFRRDDGARISPPSSSRPPARRTVAPRGTSWLAIDDAFIGNTPTGELVAIDASTEELRWRHVLGPRPLEADVPRRLEPVLRGGALFVPCSFIPVSRPGSSHDPQIAAGVTIIRPHDGAVLGTIAPTDAIPDMLRVDERCDVYVAEESGHLVAFGALPRLSLV
jgi:outer membrane protein assembly factor BamB